MPEILIVLIKIIAIVFVFVMGLASMLTLFGDRKLSAKVQNRVGPMQARFFGLSLGGIPHFVADGVKMILKENTIPEGANKFLHTLAPTLVFIPVLIGWAIMPFNDAYCVGEIQVLPNYQEVCYGEWKNYFQIMNFNSGLLFAFAIAAVGVYGAAIAGWASNNKYSMLGGLRSTAQMISYEVSLGLSLAGILLIYGTLDLNQMVIEQGAMLWGWIPLWGIVIQPVAFFIFFLAGMAETKRTPFDLPEGDSEIVAGFFTEYSSMKFAAIQLTDYAATVFFAALSAAIFLGGWQVPFLYADGFYFGGIADPTLHLSMPYSLVVVLRVVAMLGKILFVVWLQFMMRWTLPRFRYDQIMTLGWKILLPLSLANLVITAIIVAIF